MAKKWYAEDEQFYQIAEVNDDGNMSISEGVKGRKPWVITMFASVLDFIGSMFELAPMSQWKNIDEE